MEERLVTRMSEKEVYKEVYRQGEMCVVMGTEYRRKKK
jgi:hypothetical protein